MTRAVTICAIVIALAVAAGAAWFAYSMWGDRSHPSTSQQIVVVRGSTFHDIAAQLAGAGIIGNPTAFRIYAKLTHADTTAHAGEFRFAAHQTPSQVLQQLQSGGAQIARWVTIPEGFTAKQIAQRLQDEGFGDARTFAAAFLRDSIVVGAARTKNLEGFLFPSTYLIPNGASPKTVERILTAQFRKELPREARRKARALGLTVPQVVTLASLIEREAKADDERPLMAGVYYNRLRLGMPLEVDATIEYALPEHHDVITYGDLKSEFAVQFVPARRTAADSHRQSRGSLVAGGIQSQTITLSVLCVQRQRPSRFRAHARRAKREHRKVYEVGDSMSTNGDSGKPQSLELRDVLVIQTTEEKQLEFEVVGLVEDEENKAYAVLYCEKEDEFVVTDEKGTLLEDDDLAQEILDDFFVLAEESGPEGGGE